MNLFASVPSPFPAEPMPIEIPQPTSPPLPDTPVEIPDSSPAIVDPPPAEPSIPVREPGISVPAQA